MREKYRSINYIEKLKIARDKRTTESLASKLHTQQTVHLASCNTVKSITRKEIQVEIAAIEKVPKKESATIAPMTKSKLVLPLTMFEI